MKFREQDAKSEDRPNPGDPGPEIPDPSDTQPVDPKENEKIHAYERVHGPGPKDAGKGEAGDDALARLKRR